MILHLKHGDFKENGEGICTLFFNGHPATSLESKGIRAKNFQPGLGKLPYQLLQVQLTEELLIQMNTGIFHAHQFTLIWDTVLLLFIFRGTDRHVPLVHTSPLWGLTAASGLGCSWQLFVCIIKTKHRFYIHYIYYLKHGFVHSWIKLSQLRQIGFHLSAQWVKQNVHTFNLWRFICNLLHRGSHSNILQDTLPMPGSVNLYGSTLCLFAPTKVFTSSWFFLRRVIHLIRVFSMSNATKLLTNMVFTLVNLRGASV